MNERSEFNKRGEEILDFVETYCVLRYEHLDKFFPGSKKIVNYLMKVHRLYKCSEGICIGTDPDLRPDKSLLAALGVLADVFVRVKTHTRATPPAQISFITHNGDCYEIIYVGYGMEAMVAASFDTQFAAKQRSKDYMGTIDTIKRIVIVEDKSQMERLHIPGIARFALITPDGSLSYFKGS